MNPIIAAENVTSRLNGKCATVTEMERLRARLPGELFPHWLGDLFLNHRLIGMHFSLDETKDPTGLGVSLIWMSPEQMFSEALEAEPGRSVISKGFVPIGLCATGSGDPYFLDLRSVTDDPPIVRVPHEFATEVEYPEQSIEPVGLSLSEFILKSEISK